MNTSTGSEVSKDTNADDPIDVTALFDISPIAALELLCENVGRLTRPVEDGSASIKQQQQQQQEHLDYTRTAGRAGVHAADEPAQQSMLAKRFLSKRVPPITLKNYLLRLHRFCPMSTADYLATSVYVSRIVVEGGFLRVTPKNVHRLVLAGLRVAVKVLEDLGYPQSRFARVGGVSERELSRLEIGFCFLVDFELLVDAQTLMRQVRLTRAASNSSPST